jgi:hypothetical protein
MYLCEVAMKYGILVVFIRLDSADIRRLVGRTTLAVSAWLGPVFKVFLWVVFLAPVAILRVFLLNQKNEGENKQ